MKMRPIIEYTDYRRYIADFYAERKNRSAFTWRDFALKAKFSSAVFLKYVCEGKKNLTSKSAIQVAEALELVGYEKTYFCLLVDYANAETEGKKTKIFNEIVELSKIHKVKVLGKDEFEYYNTWKHSVIREIAPVMQGALPKQIAKVCKQKITAAEVSDSLKFLLQAGFLTKDEKGNYHQTDRSVRIGNVEAVSFAVKNLQKEMLNMALNALDEANSKDRSISGLTIGVTSKAYEQIVEEIRNFRRRIIAIATEDNATDEVYRLNFQFFPLTQMKKVSNKIQEEDYEQDSSK